MTYCEPRRIRTVEGGDGWYNVSHSDFGSSDVVLAVAVAAEFDRIDPLLGYPCECAWCDSLNLDPVIVP